MAAFVYPYKQGSKSAVALAQALGSRTIRLTNSQFRPRADKVVVNWGSTTLPADYATSGMRVLNPGDLVRRASNKLMFFEAVAAAPEAERPRVPPFTTRKAEAAAWLQTDKPVTIFARTELAGHSGAGIVKITTQVQLDTVREGTLLCLYVPKRREFRIHVSRLGPFSIQEKKVRRVDNADAAPDFQVRNLANGFVFARNDLADVPNDVLVQARKALAVTGLDFGAVDVIYNDRKREAYVLEVNTAPGLEGQTVLDYQAMLESLINVRSN